MNTTAFKVREVSMFLSINSIYPELRETLRENGYKPNKEATKGKRFKAIPKEVRDKAISLFNYKTRLTNEYIGKECSVSASTVSRWRTEWVSSNQGVES